MICPMAEKCIWKNECNNTKPHKHINGVCDVTRVGKYSWCNICADEADYLLKNKQDIKEG